MLLILIVIIVIGFFLLSNTLDLKKDSDPLNVLKQRLAKGEITLDEYKKAKNELV